MNRRYLALACALIAASPAAASLQDYGERIWGQTRSIDLGGEDKESLNSAMDVGCTVRDALKAAVEHQPGRFGELLNDAKRRLETVSQKLQALADRRSFKRYSNKSGIATVYISGRETPIQNGDDILRAIVQLALEAKAAIDRLDSGKGDEGDLNLVAIDTAKISELVFAFYTSQPA